MTWQNKLSLGLAAMALLSGCDGGPPPPAPAPQLLAPPPLSAADIAKAEQHAYATGYAAGRHYQKLQDAHDNSPDPASPAPTAPPSPAMAPVPVQPAPPPAESYAPKGPAQPVATPLN